VQISELGFNAMGPGRQDETADLQKEMNKNILAVGKLNADAVELLRGILAAANVPDQVYNAN
jgi:hypothetical protein